MTRPALVWSMRGTGNRSNKSINGSITGGDARPGLLVEEATDRGDDGGDDDGAEEKEDRGTFAGNGDSVDEAAG